MAVRVVDAGRAVNAAWHRELAAGFALLAFALACGVLWSFETLHRLRPEQSWYAIALRCAFEIFLILFSLANALRETAIARRPARLRA
jgi:hypothetical protein